MNEDEKTGHKTADDLDEAMAASVQLEEDGVQLCRSADLGSVVCGPLDLEEELAQEGSELLVGVRAGETGAEASAGGFGDVDQGDDFGDFGLDGGDLGGGCCAADSGARGIDGEGVLVAGAVEGGDGGPHVCAAGDGAGVGA